MTQQLVTYKWLAEGKHFVPCAKEEDVQVERITKLKFPQGATFSYTHCGSSAQSITSVLTPCEAMHFFFKTVGNDPHNNPVFEIPENAEISLKEILILNGLLQQDVLKTRQEIINCINRSIKDYERQALLGIAQKYCGEIKDDWLNKDVASAAGFKKQFVPALKNAVRDFIRTVKRILHDHSIHIKKTAPDMYDWQIEVTTERD